MVSERYNNGMIARELAHKMEMAAIGLSTGIIEQEVYKLDKVPLAVSLLDLAEKLHALADREQAA